MCMDTISEAEYLDSLYYESDEAPDYFGILLSLESAMAQAKQVAVGQLVKCPNCGKSTKKLLIIKCFVVIEKLMADVTAKTNIAIA